MIVELCITVALALAVVLLGEVFKGCSSMRHARELVERDCDFVEVRTREQVAPCPLRVRRGVGTEHSLPSLPAPQSLSDDDCYRLDPWGDLS